MKKSSKHTIIKCICFSLVLFLFLAGIGQQAYAQKGQILSIDTKGIYEGMEQPFSKGYAPAVKEDKMRLVIPFLSEEPVMNHKINVRIKFEQSDSPFIYRNYYTQVARTEKNLYLYDCEIALQPQRINGQYPIKVQVDGKTQKGEYFNDIIDIYVEITDGAQRPGGDGQNSQNGSQGSEDDKNGNQGSGDGENNQNGNQNPGDGQNGSQGSGDSHNEGQEFQDGFTSEEGEMPFSEDPETTGNPEENGQQPGGQEKEEVSYQPKILLTENNLSNENLEAGKDYEFHVGFKNYSKTNDMKHVKITLTTESPDLLLKETNWYFEKISPQETVDLVTELGIQNKSAHGSVTLQFQIEYDDSKGNTYTAAETAKLYVKQPAQASLISSSLPQKIPSTETVTLNAQVENYGLSTIYNVKVILEGAGLFPTKELFWGTIEAGTSVEGELPIYVGMKNMNAMGETIEGDAYGSTEGILKLTYEDENGTVTEESFSMKTNITKPKVEEKKAQKEQPSTQWVYAVYTGGLLLLTLVIVALSVRLLQSKRKWRV